MNSQTSDTIDDTILHSQNQADNQDASENNLNQEQFNSYHETAGQTEDAQFNTQNSDAHDAPNPHTLSSYITELEHNNAEWKDRHLRLQAEFDNFRKRTLKEKLELENKAKEDALKTLLPMVDQIEMALQVASKSDNIELLKEGLILLHKNIGNALDKLGLKVIETKGNPFDSDFHEAIAQMPTDDPEMKGKIIDEAKKGYILNEKVIRYAQVVVAE